MTELAERAALSLPVSRRDHSQGPTAAAVTLVVYGDYECANCGRACQVIREARAQLGADLRFVFRHFPAREIHPYAQCAAEAAEAASAQGRFWEMHGLLLENQRALTARHLRGYATRIGLDALRFDCELAAHVHAKRVRDDVMSGIRSGVTVSPTLFIDDVRHDCDWDLPALIQALQPRLAAQRAPPGPSCGARRHRQAHMPAGQGM